MSIIRTLTLSFLLSFIPSIAAHAQNAAPVVASALKKRMVVMDKSGMRVGPIINIAAAADGTVDYVTVISGEGTKRVPGATLTLIDGKLSTSLDRREMARSQ